jgi:all-trans-retinol 13,14-reductase
MMVSVFRKTSRFDLTFELNPDGYDHIVVGDKQIDFPKGKENLIERLKGHFPH